MASSRSSRPILRHPHPGAEQRTVGLTRGTRRAGRAQPARTGLTKPTHVCSPACRRACERARKSASLYVQERARHTQARAARPPRALAMDAYQAAAAAAAAAQSAQGAAAEGALAATKQATNLAVLRRWVASGC